MIIRFFKYLYGDFQENEKWTAIVFGSTVCSFLSWALLATFHVIPVPHWIIILDIIAVGLLVIGFFVSAFAGIKDDWERKWALAFGTALFPGFVITNVLAGMIIGAIKMVGIIGNFHKFLGSLEDRRRIRQETKRLAQQKEAEKVRIPSSGSYRTSAPTCRECGQEVFCLPSEAVQEQKYIDG